MFIFVVVVVANPYISCRQFSTIMLALLVAQIGGGIFFAVNSDDIMEKGLTESLRDVQYTSLRTFWDELQNAVSRLKNVGKSFDEKQNQSDCR